MSEKKYNHAFTIAFSLDTDLSEDEWYEHMQTKEGLSELGAHCIKRVMQVVEDREIEAYDLCDTYENH